MPHDLGPVLFAFAWPPVNSVLYWRIIHRITGCRASDWRICVQWGGSGILLAVLDLIAELWAAGIAAAASAVLAVLWWWWRRKRRRLLSLLTGKYRYIRDAMVRAMRERG